MSREQWQPKLGEPGVRVEGLAELEQSLSIVLTTPEGAVPGRPAFGSRLHELIDAPFAQVRAAAPTEVERAVRVNEPRVVIFETMVSADQAAAGGFVLTVYWRPAADPEAAPLATEVTLG